MAIAATTVWEGRTTGSDTQCSGGFNPARGGVDYTQQDTAQATGTATSSGTTLTATTGIFTSQMLGNTVTNGTTTFEITAFTSSTVVTVDAAPSWTGQTIYVGGACASPGKICASATAGNIIYLKSGTYTLTSTSNNVSGGRFTLATLATGRQTSLIGYQTTRGDLGTKPIIKADGVITTFTICTTGTWNYIDNIEFDGNSRSGSAGISLGNGEVIRCRFKNFTAGAIKGGSAYDSKATDCYATGCTTTVVFAVSTRYCVAENNTVTAFASAGGGTGGAHQFSYSINNTGASTDGFSATNNRTDYLGCVAYGSGRYGFTGSGNSYNIYTNCVGYGNTTKDFIMSSSINIANYRQCACGSAGFDSSILTANKENCITLSADPFVNAAGGNFALNSTAGGGAALKALAFPLTFPGISTSNYADIGAAQAIAAGGIIRVGMSGGLL